MQEPIVVSRGGYVAVADYKGSVLYLIGPSGNATTVETNLPILDLDVSSSGIAVAALQDDATTVSYTHLDVYKRQARYR